MRSAVVETALVLEKEQQRHVTARPGRSGICLPQPPHFQAETGHGLDTALPSGAHAPSGSTDRCQRAPALGDGAPWGAGSTEVLRLQTPKVRPCLDKLMGLGDKV